MRPTMILRNTLKRLVPGLLLTLPVLAIGQTPNWTFYNDHARGAATAPNVSTYTVSTTSGAAVGGAVTNFADGTWVMNGAAYVDYTSYALIAGGTLNGSTGGSTAPDAGTPADQIFGGKIEFADSAYYFGAGAYDSGFFITFSNLNPQMKYSFRGTAVRGNAYTGRWSLATLSGAKSSTPAHITGGSATHPSPGIVTNGWAPYGDGLMPGLQAAWNSGENRGGDVIGWDNIKCADDGTFSVITSNYQNKGSAYVPPGQTAFANTYCYAINAVRMEEFNDVVAPIGITRQPANTNVVEGQNFTISFAATGTVNSVQWYRDGVAVGTSSDKLTEKATYDPFDPNVPNPQTHSYYATLTGGVSGTQTVNTETVTVTVSPDVTPPTVIKAVAVADPANPVGTYVTVTFSEAMDMVNVPVYESYYYYFDNGTIGALSGTPNVGATWDGANWLGGTANQTQIVLYANGLLAAGTTHDLTVAPDQVQDASALQNKISAPNNVFPVYSTLYAVQSGAGGTLWSYNTNDIGSQAWNMPGYDVSAWPTGLSPMCTPPDVIDALGGRQTDLPPPSSTFLTAYFVTHCTIPAYAGPNTQVRLYYGVDDGGIIYVNGIEVEALRMPTARPATFQTLATGTGAENERRGPILLTNGWATGENTIAMEVHQNAATSSDVSFGLELVVEAVEWASGPVSIDAGGQPQGGTINEGQPFTFSVNAKGALPLTYQWYKNNAIISGATGRTYTILAASGLDTGDYKVVVDNDQGEPVTSSTAHLTVNVDLVKPVAVLAFGGYATNTTIVVHFSKPMDPVTAVQTTRYTLNGPGGLTVTGAAITDVTNVSLTISGARTEGETYTLTITGVKDATSTGNLIDPNPTTLPVLTLVKVIDPNEQAWQYLQMTTKGTPATCLGDMSWTMPGFAAAGWETGYGLFYGNRSNDIGAPLGTPAFSLDGTPVQTFVNVFTNAGNNVQETNYLFRTTFNFNNPVAGAQLLLHTMVDDGAAFYLNGVLVDRVNLTNETITCNTLANPLGGLTWDPDLTEPGRVIDPKGALVQGANVLAVDLHQESATSSDVALGVMLEVAVGGFVPQIKITPSWNPVTKQLTLTWSAPGYRLQSSTTVGPSASWADDAAASGVPFTVPATGNKFYRLIK